jgi:hypothetical protein
MTRVITLRLYAHSHAVSFPNYWSAHVYAGITFFKPLHFFIVASRAHSGGGNP